MAAPSKQTQPRERSNSSVRVEIFDQGYNLSGPDPQYILKLAEYVDAKMRAVAAQSITVDSLRVAVLAALNLADELAVLRDRNEAKAQTSVARRANELNDLLDQVLAG